MAKAIYLQEYREDYMYIHFFRNPKALEAKKNELLQDAEFVKNIEDNVEALNEGTFSYSKGLAYFAGDVGDGKYYTGWDGPEFRDMTEEEFRAQVEKHIEVFDAGKEKGAGGLCWWGKQAVKGSYYEDSRTGMEFPKDMTQPKIDASDGMYHTGELDEKTTFKYVPTFESFTAPQKVSKTNENWAAKLADYERKGMLDNLQTQLKRMAADMANEVQTGIELDAAGKAAGEPDYGWEKMAMGIIKDAFKKEKIKLK